MFSAPTQTNSKQQSCCILFIADADSDLEQAHKKGILEGYVHSIFFL